MNSNLIHKPNYDYMLFPILTYIFKLCLTTYHMIYITPFLNNVIPICIIHIFDVIHIFVSILYNLHGKVPYYDKIDYLSINMKMLVNSYMYHFAHISKSDYNQWHIAPYINILLMIYVIFISLMMRDNINYICRKEKYTYFVSIFLLGVIPMILYNFMYIECINLNLCITSYIIGGIIWVSEVPEKYIKIRYLDSVGWMHICVIIGDIFLINTIGYN